MAAVQVQHERGDRVGEIHMARLSSIFSNFKHTARLHSSVQHLVGQRGNQSAVVADGAAHAAFHPK